MGTYRGRRVALRRRKGWPSAVAWGSSRAHGFVAGAVPVAEMEGAEGLVIRPKGEVDGGKWERGVLNVRRKVGRGGCE